MMVSRLYAIIDAETLARRGVSVAAFAWELRDAGVKLVQYRDKTGEPQTVLRAAADIQEIFRGSGAQLVLNDRADLASLADWDGVHVGHLDLSPDAARHVLGPGRVVGVSTHNEEQVRAADAGAADYVAIGPVFATASKADTEPTVGLESVRRARTLTYKPLVAIGGITRANAREVLMAGADAVAVIGGFFVKGESVKDVARDFLRILG